MRKLAGFSLLFLAPLVANAQAQSQMQTARKVLVKAEPECAQSAICFSGQVREGEEFRKALNADLEFVLHVPG